MITTDRPTLTLAELDAYDPRPAGAGVERRYCCPLEGCRDKPVDRAHQSLCVNVESGLYVCYRCTARSKLVERWDARPAKELRRVRARARFALAPEAQPGHAASAPLLEPILAACVPVAGTPGATYLAGRGIGPALATAAGVLYAQRWYGEPAVVFTMVDDAGTPVAATGRLLSPPPGMPSKLHVGDAQLGAFFTPGAQDTAPRVLCEAPIDALSLAVVGVPAVALVGTAGKPWLRRWCAFRRVILAFDNDVPDRLGRVAGDDATARLTGVLAPFATAVVRWRPGPAKDWNALLTDGGPRAVHAAIVEAEGPGWLTTAVLGTAGTLGWPEVMTITGQTIGPGEADWRRVLESPRLVEPARGLLVGGLRASLSRRLAAS